MTGNATDFMMPRAATVAALKAKREEEEERKRQIQADQYGNSIKDITMDWGQGLVSAPLQHEFNHSMRSVCV